MKKLGSRRILALLLSVVMVLSVGSAAVVAGIGGNGGNPAGFSRLEELSDWNLADLSGQFDRNKVSENPFRAEDEYWVIVRLRGDTVADKFFSSRAAGELSEYALSDAGIDAAKAVENKQEKVLRRISRAGVSYELKYAYTLLDNALALKVRYGDIDKIRGISGVESVTLSERYASPKGITTNDANVYSTGIYNTEGIDYTGKGMLVAVLDTGLDQSHQAFQVMPEGENLVTYEDVKNSVFDGDTSKGLLTADRATRASDVYYNAKVPFAYDYADKDPVVYPSYSSHGTHVAGIIAGADSKDFIKDQDGNYILDKNGEPMTFKGVAPDAQLAICKVFTDDENKQALGGAETIDILAALEDCVKLNVDVINMSLGSSAGFTTGEDEHMIEVYDSVRAAGISLIVAASNDYSSGYGGPTGTNLTSNPDSSTVGAPSTFDAALSVASINGQLSPYVIANRGGKESYAYFTEASDGNGNPKKFVEELLGLPSVKQKQAADGSVTLDYVVVPGYGTAASYTSNINVRGKIALVQRGGNVTFEEKEMTAKRMGAVGCIIYNNLSGIIRMSLGNDKTAIPTCSITMDAAKDLIANAVSRKGTITISKDYKSGPFMSDFSSWGPNPDLKLKPEISAHGGEITSAVPGGWDEYSGTSMAAPNMAGVMSLLLEHIRTNPAFEGMSSIEQVAVANQLVMSTATIAKNEYGDPYSPRKQGAGLADVRKVIDTKGYLFTKDASGAVMDKTKIELGDDPQKTGVYELKFWVRNITDAPIRYAVDTYTMTETLSSDNRTVAERAYMLDSLCDISVKGDDVNGNTVNVPANSSTEVTVTIRLSGEAKSYLDRNFENGMYIEGFVRLEDADGEVNLNLPWLAFYGDWYAAPMFDISDFELSEALQDASIPEEDKPTADIYATLPVGLYNNEQYIIPLGTYLYQLPEGKDTIYSSTDKAAISCFDEKNHRTVYELYGIYAGLLRGCKTVEIVITDAITGEIVFAKTETNVRKAYTGGSTSVRPGAVNVEFNPREWNLANNRQYNFVMKGTMDKVLQNPDRIPEPTGGAAYSDTYEFRFTIDTEAPEILDYRVRYQAYEENYETKYKVYLDVDVFDNAYAQSVALCYGNMKTRTLELLTNELMPVYQSERGTKTTVTLDITDYYDTEEDLYIQVDDYALNARAYRISDFKSLPEAANYPNEIEITSGELSASGDYREIDIQTNEAFKLAVSVMPENAASTNLFWTSSNPQVVRVHNGEIFGLKEGYSYVTVYAGPDASAKVNAVIRVNVSADLKAEEIKIRKISFGMIQDKNDAVVDPNGKTVGAHPNTTYTMKVEAEPWYYSGALPLRWTTSDANVATVTDRGVVKTLAEGVATITAVLLDGNGNDTIYTANMTLNVGPEFVVENGYLREYHGTREKVTIPKTLNVYYIYEEAFMNNDTVVELEISSPCTEIQAYAFANMRALKRVILPDTVTFVSKYAFYGCTNLERIDLRTKSVTFGESTFEGCTSLKYINSVELASKYNKDEVNILDLSFENGDFIRTSPRMTTIGNNAFKDCTALESVDLTQLRVCGEFAFRNCGSLKEVTLSKFTAIGPEMFYECNLLSKLIFTDTNKFDFEGLQLPFDETKITEIQFADNTGYTVLREKMEGVDVTMLFEDAEMTRLVWVSQNATVFTVPSTVTEICDNALGGNIGLKAVDFSNASVRKIGAYALAGTGMERIVIPASVQELGIGALSYNYSLLEAVIEGELISLPEMMFFENLFMTTVDFPSSVREIGDRCFYHTRLNAVDWTDKGVVSLGDEVFGQCLELADVKLPALSEIGARTFWLIPEIGYTGELSYGALRSVSFAEGASAIGSETFAAPFARKTLESVLLPASLKSLTELPTGVFMNCTAIETLGFDSLVKISDYAFYNCAALKNLNTSTVRYLGKYALSGCDTLTELNFAELLSADEGALSYTSSLKSFSAPKVKTLGARALYASGISKSDTPNLENAGDYAFANSSISGTFEIPASLRSFGKASFAGIRRVTSFRFAGEHNSLFAENGVLYSRLKNGLQLEAYPGAKAVSGGYTVKAGTIRIGDSAFENASRLTRVILPYELAAIGDKAFYASSVKEYRFTGLRAPHLEAFIVDGDAFGTDTNEYKVFGKDTLAEDKFYANFSNYAAYVKHAETTGITDLGLTLNYPANAYGFDNRVWELFFSTVEKSEVIADDNTQAAEAALAAMPTEAAILVLKDSADREQAKTILSEYKVLVKAARSAYGKITDEAQLAFLTQSYVQALPACEAAIREVRKAFGEDVRIVELKVEVNPNKTEYIEGEVFDPTGMVLTAVFDDGSTIEITSGYEYSREPLEMYTQNTPVTYEGVTANVNISVTQKSGGDEPLPEDKEPTGCACGMLSGGTGAGLAGLGILALGLLVFRRKKA